MNFRACSSVSRHVLCLICVIFYDGPPYIFMIELVNIIHISIHMLHKKKFGFRLLFLLFFHSLSISSWLSVYPSLFLSVNIWISGIGVCLYFFLSSYLYGVLHFNALLSNICSHFRCADGICGHFFWIHCRLFAIGRSISFYIHWLSLLLHSDVIALDYIINCLSNQPFIKLIPMLAIGIVSRCVYLLTT